MSDIKPKLLITEDADTARQDYQDFFRDTYDIDFVDTLISLDEFLFTDKGYEYYSAVVIDLNLEMPGISFDRLKKEIAEFKDMEQPTRLESNIPLYGFDYFIRVILTRAETQQMVKEKRVILFSGHAAKIIKEGLFSDGLYPNTHLIDRADNGTEKLSKMIKNLISK